MIREVHGKPVKGYSRADGVHWFWGDTEVAVIDEFTSEIEWCVRKFTLPEDVIQHIRDLRPRPKATWTVAVKEIKPSVCGSIVDVQINGRSVASFSKQDDSKLEPGKYVRSAFWHKLDNIYHISEQAKKVFDSEYVSEYVF